jgi:hypothetical protein
MYNCTFDNCIGLIPLPVLGHVVVERIIWVGRRQETLKKKGVNILTVQNNDREE